MHSVNLDSKVGAVGFMPILFSRLFPYRLMKVNEDTGEPIRDPKTGWVITCEAGEAGELIGKIDSKNPMRNFDG